MDSYIVAPSRAIVTKAGIRKPGEKIKQIECGKNWNILISKGWIIKQEDLKIKNEIEAAEMQLVKLEEKKIEKAKRKVKVVKKEKNEFGAKKE